MNPVPDRKKLRREYLKRKAKAYANLAGTILILAATLYTIFDALLKPGHLSHFLSRGMGFAVCMAMVLILSASLARGVRSALSIAKGIQHIPYIPPLDADTLPAQELLVRGAEEPAATREALLRATTEAPETKSEQLLRSAQE